MGLERELKFSLSADAARALSGHALLLLAGAPRLRSLRTLYFDTEALELGAVGLVLRLRDDGAARVLTVKARGDDALGAVRQEWEWPALDSFGDTLGARDLEHALRHTGLGRAAPGAPWQARLAPRFQTRFERHAWDIEWQGARIELALDQGACVALREGREHSANLCELELEVLQGELAQAWDLAWTLGQDLALVLSPIDKARRAVALLRAERLPVPAEPGPLVRDATMQQAVRQWLHTACAQLAVWAERIAEADDAHDVHQFRVVLRRLRTALRWLAGQLPRGAARWLRGELRWAHQLAGLVRDADVSLQLLAQAAARPGPVADQAGALARPISGARAQHRLALQAYVRSARFARLLMALGRCGDVGPTEPRAGALRRMAAQALRQDEAEWRDAIDVECPLGDCTAHGLPRPEQALRLHRLRIASKRLRLSAERLSGLMPRKARHRYAQAGKLATALQTHLGAWHDADRLLQSLASGPNANDALRPWLESRAAQALREARQALAQAVAPRPRQARPVRAADAFHLPAPADAGAESLLEPPRSPAQSVEAPAAGDGPWSDELVADVQQPDALASVQALPAADAPVDADSPATNSAR